MDLMFAMPIGTSVDDAPWDVATSTSSSGLLTREAGADESARNLATDGSGCKRASGADSSLVARKNAIDSCAANDKSNLGIALQCDD